MATTVKEQLIALGMDETDFDRHESDLYVRVTDVSKNWLETYEFKSNVSQFRDQIEGAFWYDVPFAAMDEQQKERQAEAEWLKNLIRART